MNKGLKKAVVFGLSAGLVLTSLAGCSKKDKFDAEAAAITVNGDTVSAGVLNFALRYTQAIYESAYMSWGLTDPFNQDMFGNGTTLGESMKQEFATNMSRALLAEQKMEDYGVSLTDDEKSRITEAASSFIADNEEDVLNEIGATQEIVERYLELTTIQNKVETEMCADVDTEVSDEEAAQRKIRYAFFAPVTEETEAETDTEVSSEAETEAVEETEEESAALELNETNKSQSADETEAETEGSSELETEAEETETEDPAAAAAKEKAREQAVSMIQHVMDGEDFDAAAEELGKTASDMTFGADYSIAELVAATDGLEDGTLVEEPVETDNGYYVVNLVSQLDREATDAEKESIVEERKDDRIEELYTEWEEAGEVSVDEEVLAKIVFDYHLTPYEETEEATESVTEAETEAADETEAETAAETEAADETEAETTAETEAADETEAETGGR